MKKLKVLIILSVLLYSCGNEDSSKIKNGVNKHIQADEKLLSEEVRPDFSSPLITEELQLSVKLPETLTWYTSKPGIWGSERAKQGGTINLSLSEFPQTFRVIGPNSNGGFRSYLDAGESLVSINVETMEWMPQLATHWAFGSDKKTVYFKLHEKAMWNDGEKITADDYLFLLKMMRSKNIKAPWYNDRYTTEIVSIKKYSDYLISITGNIERESDDLLLNLNQSPKPEHHYSGDIPEDFVEKYQWVYEPTAGPYKMSSFKKGESISFTKVNNWWGYDYEYNKYRYNIDNVNIKVITGGLDIQKQYFLNGQTDILGLTIPKEWAASAETNEIKKGYIDRYSSFYEPLTGLYGIALNTKAGVLKDQNVRTGLYYAVNVQKMIDTVLRGEYKRYHNIGLAHVFAGVSFDDDTIRKPDFDPIIASDYFIKAGYTEIGDDGIRVNDKGERLSFELLYSSEHLTQRISVLKEDAKKAGLEIVLNNMTEGAFTILLEKKHEAFFLGMSTFIIPLNWQYFHSDNAKPQTNNFFMIEDDELDNLVDMYKNESNLQKMANINKKIQRRVHDLALVIPTYYVPYTRGASWKWIRYPSWLSLKYSDTFMDPLYSCMSGYTGYNWVDEEIKKEVIQAKIRKETFESRTYIDRTYEK